MYVTHFTFTIDIYLKLCHSHHPPSLSCPLSQPPVIFSSKSSKAPPPGYPPLPFPCFYVLLNYNLRLFYIKTVSTRLLKPIRLN